MRVLLVHGLARTRFSMRGLGRTLERAGHEARYFGYFAFATSYEDIRTRLATELLAMSANPAPVALLAHSLGGLLLRDALADATALHVHRLIMLGTPNRSSRMAEQAAKVALWRLWSGSCGALLASPAAIAKIPVPRVPYTVIAGTAGPRNPLSPIGGEPNDGFIAVSETKIVGSDVPELFPALHTFIMNDSGVQRRVGELLGDRR